jgi:putative FmdB family regulatory protein
MPIYEYKCPKCSAQFERLLRSHEREEPQPCPNKKCNVVEAKKLISRTSFTLKGGGWASDGYSG